MSEEDKQKKEPPKKQPEKSEEIIYASGERPLLRKDDDIFSGAGNHVARLQGTVAYDQSGRYVGTLVENRLVFQDEDSLTSGPLFVRATHEGFTDVGNIPHRTLDREVSVNE
jgi:hypothetical protein